jgi:hypothetical protein
VLAGKACRPQDIHALGRTIRDIRGNLRLAAAGPMQGRHRRGADGANPRSPEEFREPLDGVKGSEDAVDEGEIVWTGMRENRVSFDILGSFHPNLTLQTTKARNPRRFGRRSCNIRNRQVKCGSSLSKTSFAN